MTLKEKLCDKQSFSSLCGDYNMDHTYKVLSTDMAFLIVP